MNASDTEIVESRLARARALVVAIESVVARNDGFDPAETAGWLKIMAFDELDRVTSAPAGEALNRRC
jgi:hypothetical protein